MNDLKSRLMSVMAPLQLYSAVLASNSAVIQTLSHAVQMSIVMLDGISAINRTNIIRHFDNDVQR